MEHLMIELDYGIHTRSFPGSPLGGDLGLVIPQADGALMAMVDATGHGLSAYAITRIARSVILDNADQAPDELLRLLNARLTGTDGASASIIRLQNGKIHFSGIGNIRTLIGQHRLTPKAGMLGQRMRTPDISTLVFPAGQWLLMHTDGVSTVNTLPFPVAHATGLAHKIVDLHGSPMDDACALVLRWQMKGQP